RRGIGIFALAKTTTESPAFTETAAEPAFAAEPAAPAARTSLAPPRSSRAKRSCLSIASRTKLRPKAWATRSWPALQPRSLPQARAPLELAATLELGSSTLELRSTPSKLGAATLKLAAASLELSATTLKLRPATSTGKAKTTAWRSAAALHHALQ